MIRQRFETMRKAVIACAVATVAAAPLGAATALERTDAFTRSGLDGTGTATMHSVTVPARVGRVAVVPGTGGAQAWAIGHSLSPQWESASPAGQLVFLRYDRRSGWRISGPALDASGAATDATLYAFALAAGGEGWAVGADGVMFQKTPASNLWRRNPVAESVPAGKRLTSVSLVRTPSGVEGYAVGDDATILRYANGRWVDDLAGGPPPQMIENGELIGLGAVAAVSGDEAWAIAGPATRGVRVFHRVAGGTWRSVDPDSSPDRRIFAGPFPARGRNGGAVHSASGVSVAADPDGAWIGGSMLPGDAVNPVGDDRPGERTRPFVIRISANEESRVGYCPYQYGLRHNSEDVPLEQSALCDEPFPMASFDVTNITIAGGGHVFAGGLGLFHFSSGTWSREPDTIGYLIAVSMTSPSEGWVATTGNTFGGGTTVHSSETVLGHWTAAPVMPAAARWPQPQSEPLQAVAIAPDDSGRALAVGEAGAVVEYAPGVGWDSMNRVSERALHAVAWADTGTAWAVGENGTIQRYERGRWVEVPESREVTRQSLFGVAFASRTQGYVVGASGTILRFDGARWRRVQHEATEEDLYAIAATPDGFVAAGADGTIIEDRGGGWRAVAGARSAVTHPRLGAATFYAVEALRDGTVLAGGERSALLIRTPGGRFEPFGWTLEGTIFSLAGARDGAGTLRLFAALSIDERKFRGDRLGATRGVLAGFDGSAWRDLSLSRLRSMYPTLESSAYVDPPFAVAVEPNGTSGWAAGGFPADTPDEEGHLRTAPTSSIYRFDTLADPAPPNMVADVRLPERGINLAFFGESWCGRSVCSLTLGSGTQADLVAMQIRNEISRASKLPNGVRFAMFAGNGRATGLPEELGQERAFLGEFDVPVYGAIGTRDLFFGLEGSPGDALVGVAVENSAQATIVQDQLKTGGNAFWKLFLAGLKAPWGDAPAPAGFDPVPPTSGTVIAGRARTHYAFDYAPAGRKLLRVIIVDSSTRSYGDPSEQNPQFEEQGEWLKTTLLDARTADGGKPLPSIIVMNQPTIFPDRTPTGQPNWTGGPGGRGATDARTFAQTVYDPPAYGVSAVLTGGLRRNLRDGYPASINPVVPLYILGAGGAPLGYEPPTVDVDPPSKLPNDGFYHSWFVVNIDPSVRPEDGLPGQAQVTVIPFPVLESIAMHAVDGHVAGAGNTMRFSALARAATGGDSDPEQSKATYYPIGFDSLALCEGLGQGNGACKSREAVRPSYRFSSENPEIADFVIPDYGKAANYPLRPIGGKVLRDPTGEYGLLCTFKAGTTYVNVESGFRRARMKVTVDGGFGPCVDKPVPPLPPKPVVKGVVRVAPEERPPRVSPPEVAPDVAALPLPPVPILAPAPPVAGGYAKREKHESAREEQRHEFRALPAGTRYHHDPSLDAVIMLGSITSIVAVAVVWTFMLRRRPAHADVRWRR